MDYFLADGSKVSQDCLQQHWVHSANTAVSYSLRLTFVFTHTWETNEFHMKTEKGADSQEEKTVGWALKGSVEGLRKRPFLSV